MFPISLEASKKTWTNGISDSKEEEKEQHGFRLLG